ncbi:MAG: lantibiotic transporter permease [Anaerocolumna sp.]|jgi:ribose transport system ATP-binding protein|nr:lantibiotic transporter permease [Anaerocolumna sp.]
MQNEYKVQLKNITKHFGGVKALTDVTLQIKKGEIHALIGENGAGKSTLMKILSGAYQKDSGQIFIDGREVKITSPKEAKDLGVAVIYQEFMLAPDLTVAENIFIDKLVDAGMFINWKTLKVKAKEQLLKLGFNDIDPSAKVGTLSVAYQQVVEICKCLTRNAEVLVLDEPTAVLTFSEIEKLFSIIRQLKSEGVSIVYISHRLEEIFQLSDNITVLKDGTYVDTVPTSSISKEELVSMMVGREIMQLFPSRQVKISDEILRVENLNAGKLVKNVSFSVKAGEVVGFSGLVGAGRTETMRAIFGADSIDSGKVIYFGKEVRFKSPKDAIGNGFGLLPEDRKKQGLLLEQSIRNNTTLASMHKIKNKFDIINHRKEKEYVKNLLADINTKYGSSEDNANSLSGGNQQKIALAKWLSADCKCIVFDEPTRGVDVGAKTEIYKIINNLAEQGVGVIMISSEMTELIGMCDRVIIMRQGMIAGEVDKSELNENNLIKFAMGV